jgi:hypothetical protein
VHLQTSLVQSFVLAFQNFEKVVQIIALKRFGGAPHHNQLAPLTSNVVGKTIICGVLKMTASEAERSAAAKSIRYLERVIDLEVVDLSYPISWFITCYPYVENFRALSNTFLRNGGQWSLN